MHRHPLPLACLPTDLSDETAAKLLELLYEIARTLENHYAVHINRYYHPGTIDNPTSGTATTHRSEPHRFPTLQHHPSPVHRWRNRGNLCPPITT